MKELPHTPTLKEITAFKKKLNWSEIPPIYQITATSIGDLDSILTHGFDSAYKGLFNKSNWNKEFLKAYTDQQGNLAFEKKPKICLRHVMNTQNYELHCFPVIDGQKVTVKMSNHHFLPFNHWIPEIMRMLFRINNLTMFIEFTFRNGDKADRALVIYAANQVEKLINTLKEEFDIVKIEGTSITEFCSALGEKNQDSNTTIDNS